MSLLQHWRWDGRPSRVLRPRHSGPHAVDTAEHTTGTCIECTMYILYCTYVLGRLAKFCLSNVALPVEPINWIKIWVETQVFLELKFLNFQLKSHNFLGKNQLHFFLDFQEGLFLGHFRLSWIRIHGPSRILIHNNGIMITVSPTLIWIALFHLFSKQFEMD